MQKPTDIGAKVADAAAMIDSPERSAIISTTARAIRYERAQALRRAIKALKKARDDTDHFDHGGYASHDVVSAVEEALRAEFSNKPKR